MQREYVNYVGEACKKGMSPEEVQYLFSEIYRKSDTKNGKRVLKLFAQGVGKAKKDKLMNKVNMEQNYQVSAPPQQLQGNRYQYFKQ